MFAVQLGLVMLQAEEEYINCFKAYLQFLAYGKRRKMNMSHLSRQFREGYKVDLVVLSISVGREAAVTDVISLPWRKILISTG